MNQGRPEREEYSFSHLTEYWELQHRRRCLVIIREKNKHKYNLKEIQIWQIILYATWRTDCKRGQQWRGKKPEQERCRRGSIRFIWQNPEPSTRPRLGTLAKNISDTQGFKQQANSLKFTIQRRDEQTKSEEPEFRKKFSSLRIGMSLRDKIEIHKTGAKSQG